MAKVPLRVWIGLMEDETSGQCQVVLPEHHWLEAWGDYAGRRVTLQQPTIGTLYDTPPGRGHPPGVAQGLGWPGGPDYHAYLQARWQKDCPGDRPLREGASRRSPQHLVPRPLSTPVRPRSSGQPPSAPTGLN